MKAKKSGSLFMTLAAAALASMTVMSGCGQSAGTTKAASSVQKAAETQKSTAAAGTVKSTAAAAAGSASAAKSTTVAAPAGKISSKGTVTVQFWNSAEGAMATSVTALVDKFNSTVGTERGIKVESVYQGGDVVEKLKTLTQAGDYKNFPDVGQIYSAGIPAVLQMKPILKMDDLYAGGKYPVTVQKTDLIENFIRTYTYDKVMVGMPLNASSMLMYYNKDAAKEAGLDPAKPPETMEELAKWTSALTKKNADGSIARYGLNIQIDRYELVNFLMGISKDGKCNFIGDNEGGRAGMMTKLTIGEDGSLDKFLTEWQKVIDTGGYKPVNDDERGEFANGLSAINFQSSSQLQTMLKNTKGKFELGVAPIPRCTSQDKAGASVGGGSLCMFDLGDDDKKQAAWAFVQFMASPESQLYFMTNNGYLPANKKSYELDDYKKFVKEQPEALVAVEQMKKSDSGMQEPFDIINWELNTLTTKNLISFAKGEITKEQCKSNIVDAFNEKLTDYVRANK
jgi:sn-glycerol 3-phosphate transport system substrate-binding protein